MFQFCIKNKLHVLHFCWKYWVSPKLSYFYSRSENVVPTLDAGFYLNTFSCGVTHAVYFSANMNRLLTVSKARSILFPFPGDVVDMSRCRLQPTCLPHQTLAHRLLHQSILCRLPLLLSVHFCRHSSIDSSALLAFLSKNNTFTFDCLLLVCVYPGHVFHVSFLCIPSST